MIKVGPAPGTAPVPIVPSKIIDGDDAFVAMETGGRLERSDHAALIVPPNALTDDADLSISTPAFRLQEEQDLKARKLEAASLIAVSTGVVFGPDNVGLAGQVEVAVPYDSATIVALGVPDLSLKLYAWNPDRQDWFWVPSRVDPATRTVRGKATRLGHVMAVWRKDGN